jgi:hypothetical protein
VVLRLVNHVVQPQTVTVRLVAGSAEKGVTLNSSMATVLTLKDSMHSGSDRGDNSPASPARIAPISSTVPVTLDGTVVIELPPFSFVNVVVQ